MSIYTPTQVADLLQLPEERIMQLILSEQIFSKNYYHVTDYDLRNYFIKQNM